MDEAQRYALWEKQFEAVFKGKGLDPQKLYKDALPCFYEKYEPETKGNPLEVGISRTGGYPDLPEGESWPTYDGKAMPFVAQINLRDLEPGFVPHLPQQGWLYFFIGNYSDNWLLIAHRVIYFDGPLSRLRKSVPPEGAEPPERVYQAHITTYKPGFTIYGAVQESILEGDEHDDIFSHAYDYFQPEITRIGGHPVSFQNLSELYAYLALSGLDLLVKHGTSRWSIERRIERQGLEEKDPEHVNYLRTEIYPIIDEFETKFDWHKEQMRAVHPLFVLSSDGENMQWGDLGLLQFFIHDDDLAAQRFDRTSCDLITS